MRFEKPSEEGGQRVLKSDDKKSNYGIFWSSQASESKTEGEAVWRAEKKSWKYNSNYIGVIRVILVSYSRKDEKEEHGICWKLENGELYFQMKTEGWGTLLFLNMSCRKKKTPNLILPSD